MMRSTVPDAASSNTIPPFRMIGELLSMTWHTPMNRTANLSSERFGPAVGGVLNSRGEARVVALRKTFAAREQLGQFGAQGSAQCRLLMGLQVQPFDCE